MNLETQADSVFAEELFTVNLTEKQLELFWKKINRDDKSPHDCWDWIGALSSDGYGNWWIPGQWLRATRVSYLLRHGPFPKHLSICHRCDRPICCNPDHLFAGTHKDNMRDSANKGRNGSHRYPERRPFGTKVNTAKLTESQVWEIRDRYTSGESITNIAKDYPVSRDNVYLAAIYKTWRRITRL